VNGFKYIGGRLPREDARDKARGRFLYLADLPSDALHGALLTSPLAHASVVSIDVREALELRGVRVLTFEDAPDTLYNSGEWFPGQNDHPDETLLTGHARHVGDRIALILAPDKKTAREARDLVRVEYSALPPSVELHTAEDLSQTLHCDGVRSFPGKIEYGCVDAAFSAAAHVESSTISTQKVHHAALETHAVLAVPSDNGVLEVYTPCQILFGVQHVIASILPLPLSKIRVIRTNVGGAFGGKQEVVFEPLCAWAAHKLGRAVFIDTAREETIISTRTRAAMTGTVETALDDDGRILGRRFDVTMDAGAYLTGSRKVMMAMGKKIPRLYRIPALRYDAKAVRTSTTPAGACRGYGSPQIHAVTEIHTDMICRALDFDPVEFRLKNLVHPFDRDPTGAANLGNARIIDCLERGAAAFKWAERRTPSSSGRLRRGAGFACCTHGNGYYKTIYHDVSGMSLRIMEDGSAVLRGAVHELGHAAVPAMTLIIAETTGISPDRITVTEGDSLYDKYDIGCQASRGIYVVGECARLCGERAMEKLCREAEALWDRPVRRSESGLIIGDETIPIGEAVRQIEMKRGTSIDVTVEHRPENNPGSYGVHFAQVAVDTLSGIVRVEKYLAVHDVGRAIGRNFVEGQIYGAVQMGIGMALCEDLSFDARGNPSARNFDKYHLVNAPDMPEVEIILIEEGEEGGPFGAKSIGEISTVPVAPAIVNAINRALDTELTHLPITPAVIVNALRKPAPTPI
jgi:xanthine dehydrogenase molybdenum-binding subunit